jgi:hypothetical protein
MVLISLPPSLVVPGLLRSQAAVMTAAIREEPTTSCELAAEAMRFSRNGLP